MWCSFKGVNGNRVSVICSSFDHIDISDWNFLKILHQEILEEEDKLAQLNLLLDSAVACSK